MFPIVSGSEGSKELPAIWSRCSKIFIILELGSNTLLTLPVADIDILTIWIFIGIVRLCQPIIPIISNKAGLYLKQTPVG